MGMDSDGQKEIRKALCMINMQGFSLLDIMSKSYKKGMNEMDSAGVGIVGMCITACFMELWVTVFAGRGKAALCFSMCCEHSYP